MAGNRHCFVPGSWPGIRQDSSIRRAYVLKQRRVAGCNSSPWHRRWRTFRPTYSCGGMVDGSGPSPPAMDSRAELVWYERNAPWGQGARTRTDEVSNQPGYLLQHCLCLCRSSRTGPQRTVRNGGIQSARRLGGSSSNRQSNAFARRRLRVRISPSPPSTGSRRGFSGKSFPRTDFYQLWPGVWRRAFLMFGILSVLARPNGHAA